MGRDFLTLRRTEGLRFSRQLGTGRSALPGSGVEWHQWALFAVWNDPASLGAFLASSPITRYWARNEAEACTLQLEPLRWKGRWGGTDPLAGADSRPGEWSGRVGALTRATLRAKTARTFRAATPGTYGAFLESPGVLAAAWVSETPILRFGTFSVWESEDAMKRFTAGKPAHMEAMRRTHDEGWYTEELFARFAVTRSWGTWNGRKITEDALPNA
jgi:quinol monooxygenase YgiN